MTLHPRSFFTLAFDILDCEGPEPFIRKNHDRPESSRLRQRQTLVESQIEIRPVVAVAAYANHSAMIVNVLQQRQMRIRQTTIASGDRARVHFKNLSVGDADVDRVKRHRQIRWILKPEIAAVLVVFGNQIHMADDVDFLAPRHFFDAFVVIVGHFQDIALVPVRQNLLEAGLGVVDWRHVVVFDDKMDAANDVFVVVVAEPLANRVLLDA